jgi:hypothetical protein
VPVEVQHVEDGEHGRRVPAAKQPRPKAVEVGAAVGVEADELAVEDYAMAGEGLGQRRQVREAVGAVTPWARAERTAITIHAYLKSAPVELQFQDYVVDFRQRAGTSQHRLDEAWEVFSTGRVHRA